MPGGVRGFILQPTYRIEGGRPVLELHGRLEDGRCFLVREHRYTPHFYVDAEAAARARELGAVRVAASERRTLLGMPVARVELQLPSDAPPLRERLLRAGLACHEADVRYAMSFLIDRGIKAALALTGGCREQSGVWVFDDPELEPDTWAPRLSVLSLDIETDPQARSLLSIALHGCGASEVLLLTPPGSDAAGARAFASERDLLLAFCRRVRELDPDVLTGWNVVDFDLAVLDRLARRAGVPLLLGRAPGPLRLRPSGSPAARLQATVPGRVVLDGIQLLRGAFIRMEDYGLDAVARSVLGEGKRLVAGGRAQEILRLFHEERARFVDYNLADARLALEVLERLQLFELAVARSLLTGMPLDRVASSIAAFDFLYMSELRPRGIVAPSVGGMAVPEEAQSGGHVLEPKTGLYRNVCVLDFRSLYPSLIRTFQIDPLNLLRDATDADAIVAPNAARFARRRGILTELLDRILPERERARAAGDQVKSQAIKILMNSFYGVLGTSACRFYDPRLANAITGFGRELLLWTKARVEARSLRVLYGDTDSLFVATGQADAGAARELSVRLALELNRELAAHILATWRVESRLDLGFDRLYLRLFLPPMRQAAGGARKRYAGLLEDGRVVFTGMEAVRGDWTDLAREVQRELYARLFHDQPVDEYLRLLVAELRAGRLDERLVYRKSLRKPASAYTATTPPHVAAARKMAEAAPRRIAYVVTSAGPEPAAERRSPIDHEHYVDKQVRAVAEPVLALLGLDFVSVIGDARQLSLF
jgi:DNA polymerase-2